VQALVLAHLVVNVSAKQRPVRLLSELLNDLVEDVLLLMLRKGHFIAFSVQLLRALLQNELRGALNVDTDVVLAQLNSGGLALAQRVEWNRPEGLGTAARHLLVNVLLSLNEKVDYSGLSDVTFHLMARLASLFVRINLNVSRRIVYY